MSYTISITRNNIPAADDAAWEHVFKLQEEENGPPAQDFIDLIKKFTATYPCICDLPDDQADDGVWSDGPLVDNAGNQVTILGISPTFVDEVMPFIVETANKHGFVVFDEQEGQILRPRKS